MPIAVTVFGVAKRGAPSIFCYAFFRDVRGPGDYPAPTLPTSIPIDGIRRLPIDGFDLELVTWDKIFDEGTDGSLQSELDSGRFSIPAECPIESNTLISGQPFGPILIAERSDRIRTSGTGILYVKGFAVGDGIDRVTGSIAAAIGPAKAPIALMQVIELIASQSGLGLFFTERRRIGVVDQFYRAQNVAGIHGTLFDVIADKPDFRSKNPMLRVRIRRDAAALDKLFRLHITLKNFDEILKDDLLDFPAGQPEIIVEAGSHVTDIALVAFDDAGGIAERVSGAFTQSFNFGITAQGHVDELPPVFRGAPESPDLHRRARVHPTAFEGPSAGNRSGGLDALRRNRKRLDMLIGEAGQTAENRWFESGADSQIEVIRWIKTKLEKPGITKAFLVDPFLGSEALQRVIARQGNENIALTILVSPGGTNPDADTVNEKDSGDHLGKLVATAEEWSDRLCGQISIIHIQRGDGAKQAFHDRYLSVVDQQGVPTVYLLSNSLSKAAGDWPFAICELDRITSWQVHHYILGLIEGNHGDRDLRPATIWQSAEPVSAPAIASPDVSQQPPTEEPPAWHKSANAFLQDLWNVVIRNAAYRDSVGNTVNAFIASWPHGIDTKAFAEAVFRSVGYREEVIVFVSSLFAPGTAEQRDVADKLDDMLLAKFLSNLPRDDQKGAGYLPMRGDRNDYLRHIGQTIARKPSSTNYVRAELNPVLHALVQLIECQRFDFGLACEAVETGICLVSVGLEVAIASDAAKVEHRTGMAADYIHWIGRLTRSAAAHSRFNAGELVPEMWRDDLAFAARQVLAARSILDDKLEASIQRVLQDPLVLSGFKDLLRANANSH